MSANLMLPRFLISEKAADLQNQFASKFDRCLALEAQAVHCKIILHELYLHGLIPPTLTTSSARAACIFNIILAQHLAQLSTFAVAELIAHQLGFIVPVITRFNLDQQKDNLLQGCINGNAIFSRIFYESTEQFSEGRTTVIAKKSIEGWELSGRLPLMLLGPNTNFHLVFANTSATAQLTAFLVPVNAEGISCVSQAPMSSDGQYTIVKTVLAEVKVSDNSQLAAINLEYLQTLIAKNRIFSAIRNNVRARLNLDEILIFLRARKANGQSLINLDVLQHRMASLDAECAMSLALSYAAVDGQLAGDNIQSLAKGSKFFAAELLQKIAREALHLGGISHYRTDSKISQFYQEARWSSFFVEADEILLHNI